MKCLNCNVEIESDDNFCWNCGHWTIRGYSFLQDQNNIDKITKGDVIKQDSRFSTLTVLFLISMLLFLTMFYIQGQDLFRPIAYIQKQITTYIYGYKTTLINTEKKYVRKNVSSYDQAIEYIKGDFNGQSYLCNNDANIYFIENELEESYAIPKVVFCDISVDEATKIKQVVSKMYSLFPNISGALTNITISNASSNSEYIARFQPMYQFVNVNENINDYNKVNKTQILLNSYYFLNTDILQKPIENIVGKGWYVKDATWESTIAHELGHYISFITFLRENNIKNITFVTPENNAKITQLLNDFDSGNYSTSILNQALDNYNLKNDSNINIEEFALLISKYAGSKNKKGELIADEVIAEAIHDYYLHGSNAEASSLEIIKIISSKLNG